MTRLSFLSGCLAAAMLACASQPPHAFLAQAVPAPQPPPATAPPPPQATEPPPAAIDQQPPPPPEMKEESHHKLSDPDGRGVLRTAGWVSLAVGIEAGLVGVFTGLIMLHDDHVRSQDCNAQKQCSQEGVDANDALQRLAGWNAGAWVVAAVGVTAGAILLITTSKSDDGRATSVGVSPGGLQLRSTF